MKDRQNRAKLPECLYWRKDSRYIWCSINNKSTKTSNVRIATEYRDRIKYEKHHGLIKKINKITLDEYIEKFNEYYETCSKSKSQRKAVKQRVNIFIEVMKIKKLSDINYDIVTDFLVKIKKQGFGWETKEQGVSDKTRNDYRQAIKNFTEYAMNKGYIEKSDFFSDVRILDVGKNRKFAFTYEQIKKQLEKAEEPLYGYLFTGICTSMRLGEMRKFDVEDIKMDSKVPHIQLDKTKSDRPRDIPILPIYMPYIKKVILARKTGPALPQANGKRYVGSRGPYWKYHALLKRCEIEMPHRMLFHALRHSCTTFLIESGCDPYAVMLIVGHEDLETTNDYTHVRHKYLEKQMKKLGKTLKGIPVKT